jgi:hypothetical protein
MSGRVFRTDSNGCSYPLDICRPPRIRLTPLRWARASVPSTAAFHGDSNMTSPSLSSPTLVSRNDSMMSAFRARSSLARLRAIGAAAALVILASSCNVNDEQSECESLGGTYDPSATPECKAPSTSAALTKIPMLPVGSFLTCIQVDNGSTSTSCTDSGNYPSTCASAQCPSGYTLTGGGGSCSAGNRKLKALNPRVNTREFFIMCEQQGVPPLVRAICCKI